MNKNNVALDEHDFRLFSDIHGDAQSFERMLLRNDPRRYDVCLGDVVDGLEPGRCLELVNQYCSVAIRGNHDYDIADLTKEERGIVELFVPSFRRKNLLLFHGMPESAFEYPFNDADIEPAMLRHPTIDVFFSGHLHIPRIAILSKSGGEISFEETQGSYSRHDLDLEKNRYFINIPSVANPRYNSRPGYGLLHHQSDTKKIFTFIYD